MPLAPLWAGVAIYDKKVVKLGKLYFIYLKTKYFKFNIISKIPILMPKTGSVM